MWESASRRLGRVPVVAGAVSTTGIFDQRSELVLDEQVLTIEFALTVKTAELGHLRYGDAITVDSVAYKVRHEPMLLGDGLLCILALEKV